MNCYFGLQFRGECYCTYGRPHHDVWRSYKVDDTECNMRCNGDPGEICGGANRMEIWKLDLPPLLNSTVNRTLRGGHRRGKEPTAMLQ